MSDIEINPKYKEILDDIQKLTDMVTKIIEERDHILFHENPRIAAEYISVLGRIQLEVYNIQTEVLRLKRKIEIYQMLINRQEEINDDEIELMLDNEYKEYRKNIDDLRLKIDEAEEMKRVGYMDEPAAEEFKSLYRALILKLHPDLDTSNLNLNDEEREEKSKLLKQVIDAYENGDLETLRALSIVVDTKDFINTMNIKKDSFEILLEKKERLENTILMVRIEIDEIKSKYPYNTKELLENPELVKAKQESYKFAIKQYKEIKKQLQEIFDKLLEDLARGK